jgi:hypothetical protein
MTYSSPFLTIVTRSMSGTPFTVVFRTLFLIVITAGASASSSTRLRTIEFPHSFHFEFFV